MPAVPATVDPVRARNPLLGTNGKGAARTLVDRLSEAGPDRVLPSWPDCVDGLGRFAEVMPMLEARRLREAFSPTA